MMTEQTDGYRQDLIAIRAVGKLVYGVGLACIFSTGSNSLYAFGSCCITLFGAYLWEKENCVDVLNWLHKQR